MNAPNYTDTMTDEAHTDTADPVGMTYRQATWWLSLPILPTAMLAVLVMSYAPSGAARLAVFAVAVAGYGVTNWLALVWRKRRHPERYAACMAAFAAERERHRDSELPDRRQGRRLA